MTAIVHTCPYFFVLSGAKDPFLSPDETGHHSSPSFVGSFVTSGSRRFSGREDYCILLHACRRLHPNECAPHRAVYRQHDGSREKDGRTQCQVMEILFYCEVPLHQVGVVRGLRRLGLSSRNGEKDQGMDACKENRAYQCKEFAMEGFKRRDFLSFSVLFSSLREKYPHQAVGTSEGGAAGSFAPLRTKNLGGSRNIVDLAPTPARWPRCPSPPSCT